MHMRVVHLYMCMSECSEIKTCEGASTYTVKLLALCFHCKRMSNKKYAVDATDV